MKKLLTLIALSSALLVLGVFSGSIRTAVAGGPPGHNDFANAKIVDKLPYSDSVSTTSANKETSEPVPSCQASFGHTVWYKYTPGFDQDLDIDTFGSSYDTVLAIYTGTALNNLQSVACNDDASGPGPSAIKRTLYAGTTYYFQLAGYSTASGQLLFHITPQDPVLFDDVALKCYQARIAKRSLRFQRQTISTYDPNNAIETETQITGLFLYCNQADVVLQKERSGLASPAGLDANDLKVTCYNARDTRLTGKGSGSLRGRTVFAQNEFFGDQKLQLNRLESVCVLAIKDSGQLPNFTPFNGDILRCYSARPVKGSPRVDPVRVSIADQFFKGKDARLLRPVSYCTISSKSPQLHCFICSGSAGIDGNNPDNIPFEFSVVCYSARQANTPAITIPVIDQFIDAQFVDPYLTVRKADRLCVSSVKKPPYAPNDEIKYATTINVRSPEPCNGGAGGAGDYICGFNDHVVTMNATRSRNDPPMVHCASVADHVDYGHSVWYTYTPTDSDEASVDMDTEDSSYDTVLAVYTGSKGSLTQVACNDDEEGEGWTTSKLVLDLQIGQKYYIMVGSKDRTPGGKLKLSFDPCGGNCD